MKNFFQLCVLSLILGFSACASTQSSTYKQIGGEDTIANIVDHFITEIEFDPIIIEHFRGVNIERFRSKLIEHLCFLTGGPCTYTGESMEKVHGGLNISESQFNRTVDLLITAMTKSGLSHRKQNLVLKHLVPLRESIINL